MNTVYLVAAYILVLVLVVIFVLWRKSKRKSKITQVKTGKHPIINPLEELERGNNEPTGITPFFGTNAIQQLEADIQSNIETIPSLLNSTPQALVIPGVEFVKADSITSLEFMIREGFDKINKSIEELNVQRYIETQDREQPELNENIIPDDLSLTPKATRKKHEYTAGERRAIGERLKASHKPKEQTN